MKLTINYNSAAETDYVKELRDMMELEWCLPTWFYTKKELADFTVRKYRLLKLIREEEEYTRECNKYGNSN